MNAISQVREAVALDMYVAWGGASARDASFSSGIDPIDGTIRITGGGVWHTGDAERYFADQAPIVAEARRRFGLVRAFFDVREWIVECPESATQFQDYNRQLYVPGDRLVAVVASSMAKQHPRTALCVGSPECFVSMSAAETWLQAYASSRAPVIAIGGRK